MFDKEIESLKKQSSLVIHTLLFANFLSGVAVGALLASYLQVIDWIVWGWILVAIAFLLHLPVAYVMIKK